MGSSWAPWPCPKKGPWPMPPGCAEGGGELQDLVNQSADLQKEDNVKLSWAPWPCPKKGPWPAPPLCGEGRIEIQYDVNQSEFVQKEDNANLSWLQKVKLGKACVEVVLVLKSKVCV